MGNLILSENFFVEESKKERLFQLFEEVFRIPIQTLQNFEANGFGDTTYKPFSYLQEGQVIANVSMFSLPMFVNGERIYAAGIQSVMTHPEYRRKGLMKQLLCKVLQEIDTKYECAILFTEKPELYEPFGFRVVQEYLMTLSYENTLPRSSSLRKLNFYDEKDMELIKEIIENAQQLSMEFSTLNYQSSFYFNMYDAKWNEKLYYSKKLDALIVFEVKNQVLKLFGIFAQIFPILDDICAEISEPFTEIEFYFYPDELGLEEVACKEFQSETYLMIRGGKKIDFKGYKFPVLTEF
ncbi:GNAT family N-acetyltransferase [Bacillus pseudomycoides]|uniref:GNAT family N-acetyltransferase n=1 Tax=Bacillus pseudomycoides TaxID=64104 RepID=A0A2B5HLI5_9BACI|nr:GNAT family N-acetyltransferase [Bacillus pseudomycoides]PDY45329.1 GNAT family N-acetyltransferase [Bacillus pseudomycoides]PEA82552.1 GNAT family N-acetyltransferase [Bacillus pseudomycoides]PED05674.1 GNAT family N-acetyltransferase [Bacillus pseudomycoides]PED68953.1 GNAT family N-acetyltransferase [Bacillus pseudomycoides]PEI37998.1 GNAT family N-acetyltransferase [Bacillus pseudomycoides]